MYIYIRNNSFSFFADRRDGFESATILFKMEPPSKQFA